MPADRCNCDAPSSVNEGLGELDEPCGGDDYMPRFEGLAGALLPYCVRQRHIKGSVLAPIRVADQTCDADVANAGEVLGLDEHRVHSETMAAPQVEPD